MSSKAPITFLITTKDEQTNLPHALASIVDWAAEIFVVDSGSTDRTRDLAEEAGARFYTQQWLGYAGQKNWALDHLPITCPWVFILDADEAITPALREELARIATEDRCEENAFFVNRYFVFLDRRIRHCGYYPSWNVRFFRRGKARYEKRDVHEHMIVDGKCGYLRHDMSHYDRRGIEYYIAKHNHYSTLEAHEMFKILTGSSTERSASPWGNPQERRRWIKHVIWPRLPARWFFRWLYMYILRLGVLDGKIGFHFCLFMASYEHQISLKLHEEQVAARKRRQLQQPAKSGGATVSADGN